MSENKQDWAVTNPVGRPQKKDKDGNLIYRIPTSIYLDIRMKEWIIKKAGNLSEWIEKMVRHAYQNQYCFHCFDDNIKEVEHGWICCNEKHRARAGRGAPSIVLQYKQCPNCESWFNHLNMPVHFDKSFESTYVCCGICKDQFRKELENGEPEGE